MLIADSAIALIARDGVRALTHRAVDAEADIPTGSTSSQARTRSALLEIVVDELERRAISNAMGIDAIEVASGSAGVDAIQAAVLGLIRVLAARRDDMRARYALVLEIDDPSLRRRLTDQGEVRDRSIEIATKLLHGGSLSATPADAEALVDLVDALVLHQTVTDRESASVSAVVRTFLQGLRRV